MYSTLIFSKNSPVVLPRLLVLDSGNFGDRGCPRSLASGSCAQRNLALMFDCSILVLALVFNCSNPVLGSVAIVFDYIVILRHFCISATPGCW